MLLQNLQSEIAEAILSEEKSSYLMTPGHHLAIYRNNIQSTLIKTLENTFPLMVKLLGKDFFKQTAKAYISLYPSISGNLHDYGGYFDDFIKHYAPLSELNYLAEVALFEWLCHGLYFAAEFPSLNIERLQTLSPESYSELQLMLNATVVVQTFHVPILKIIDLCKHNHDEEIKLQTLPTYLLIQRRHFEMILTPLNESEFIFLNAIHHNKPLSHALDQALQCEASFNLEETLPRWVKNKVIVDRVID